MGSRDVEGSRVRLPLRDHTRRQSRQGHLHREAGEILQPLTTRPALTSRQGMIRFASMTLRALAETGRDLKVRNSVQQPGWSCFYAVFPAASLYGPCSPEALQPRPFGRTEAPSAFQKW